MDFSLTILNNLLSDTSNTTCYTSLTFIQFSLFCLASSIPVENCELNLCSLSTRVYSLGFLEVHLLGLVFQAQVVQSTEPWGVGTGFPGNSSVFCPLQPPWTAPKCISYLHPRLLCFQQTGPLSTLLCSSVTP